MREDETRRTGPAMADSTEAALPDVRLSAPQSSGRLPGNPPGGAGHRTELRGQ